MNTELLEIQPEEIRFIFELKKPSLYSIRLANKSDHHVAFKVKTTSSEKYCVRPYTGVIKPNLTCDFTVTMQAQNLAPPDYICKDRFLIQSTIVPKGTKEEHITSNTFAKEDGKHIEEKKLKVILVSPVQSPILSPIIGISRMRSYNAATESEDDYNSFHNKVDEDMKMSRKDNALVMAMKNERSINRKHTEELRLSNDVEEMKSKLRELESILLQENLRTKKNSRIRVIGFQLLFVFVMALVSFYIGYMLHS